MALVSDSGGVQRAAFPTGADRENGSARRDPFPEPGGFSPGGTETRLRDCADAVVELDVGGQLFKTYRSTLVSGSGYFRARLSERWNSQTNGPVFVDRDPVGFAHVLNLLRDPNYPFPHETYGHELAFFIVGDPGVEAGREEDDDDDLRERHHEPTTSTKTADSTFFFRLVGLCHTGISNLKPEDNEMGPRRSTDRPILRFRKQAIFQQTNFTRVSIERLSRNNPWPAVFALYPSRNADAWDDPRLVLRFRSKRLLPRTRAEFFRLGLLSALLKKVDLLALPLDFVETEPELGEFDLDKLPILARMHSEQAEALELAREERNPIAESTSLYDRVFAESPGEISISLDCMFKLCDAYSEECDAIPYCKDFLHCVAFAVDPRPTDESGLELTDVWMTANCYFFDLPVRQISRNPRQPSEGEGELPAMELLQPPPSQLAYMQWTQESFFVERGQRNIVVSLNSNNWASVLHEIMFFVRQDANESASLLAGQRTLVRVKKVELCFNSVGWVPWSERELLEAMAEQDWKLASPVYKLHYGAQGTDLRRIDQVRLRLTFWDPMLRPSQLHVCLKTQLRMRRYPRGDWPENLQSVTIV